MSTASASSSIAAVLVVVLLAVARPPRPNRAAPTADTPGRVATWSPVLATLERFDARRDRLITSEAVAEWCDELSRRARAGNSLTQALIDTIPADQAVRRATDALRRDLSRGRSVAVALATASQPTRQRGSAHLCAACSVISIAAQVGGPLAAPIDRVAATLRLRAADQQERAAHSSQARMSAHVMTAVPLAMLALSVTLDREVRAVMLQPIALACVGIGLALNAAGWLWMQRIVGR